MSAYAVIVHAINCPALAIGFQQLNLSIVLSSQPVIGFNIAGCVGCIAD